MITCPQYLRAKPMRIVIIQMVTAMPANVNAPLILSMPKIVQFLDVSSYSQSHYIEVLRCLLQTNKKLIVNIQPILPKKMLKEIHIMQIFSADATIFSKIFQHFFAHENKKIRPQNFLIIGPIIFQYCQPAQNQRISHILLLKKNTIISYSVP